MIALPVDRVVKSELGKSVTGLAIGGFELIQLRFALTGELAFWSLAIEIGTRAVVKGGVRVDPDLGVGIAFVFWCLGSLGQPQTDEELVKQGKIGIGGWFFVPIRAPGNGDSTPCGAH